MCPSSSSLTSGSSWVTLSKINSSIKRITVSLKFARVSELTIMFNNLILINLIIIYIKFLIGIKDSSQLISRITTSAVRENESYYER